MGMSSWEQGNGRPSGPPPSGPPPSGPPLEQPPTVFPPQWTGNGGPAGPPPAGPPPGGYGGPPGGGYGGPPGAPPGGFGGPPFGQPPRKKRWPLFVASGVALALVAGLGVFGFLYFTGRLGFGPLSGADKDAVTTIAKEVEVPTWVDEDQAECAADELVHESRSKDLEDRGLIERDGDDWTYTGEWEADDATSYFAKVLDCSDDWADQVGEVWKVDDTDCLEDIGTDTIGTYFAAESLTLGDKKDDSVEKGRDEAVEALDKCYADDPAAPKATAAPAYRAVTFTFEAPDADSGEASLEVNRDGSWSPLSRKTIDIDTDEGGKQGCVSARTVTTYPWGTTKTSEDEFCGESKPKRIYWQRAKKCTAAPGCVAWQLRYEGFASYELITAKYTNNGGDCMAVSGKCTTTAFDRKGEGRGIIVTWSFPASYKGNFVGRVDGLKAKIPN